MASFSFSHRDEPGQEDALVVCNKDKPCESGLAVPNPCKDKEQSYLDCMGLVRALADIKDSDKVLTYSGTPKFAFETFEEVTSGCGVKLPNNLVYLNVRDLAKNKELNPACENLREKLEDTRFYTSNHHLMSTSRLTLELYESCLK